MAIWRNSVDGVKGDSADTTAKVVANQRPTILQQPSALLRGPTQNGLAARFLASFAQILFLPGCMAKTSDEAPRTLGFCTVRSHAEHGYFGGYLILNAHARPLEFHCTLPVKPSRAQEILYGATLADFVCGEQIAKALTSKAKLTPQVVLTDCTAVLALSRVSDLLVACVPSSSATQLPSSDATRTKTIKVEQQSLQILQDDLQAEAKLRELWQQWDVSLDISEPFQRIAEALLEAHPIMKAA